ncbi:MAG: 7TM-DISM domain-containing protein [Leptospiraceae bacterium]|nr:7TM-DISM domain-containing protein [Leptospiraceae bacterium]
MIDLRDWNFNSSERSGVIEFVGDWEFYWNELIEDSKQQREFFKNYDSTKLNYISVPSEWQNYKLNGVTLPPEGYAMYRMKVLMPPDKTPLSFSMTDISSAYSLYVNGVLHYSVGKIGKSKEDMIPFLRYGTFPLKENSNELEIVFLISNFYHPSAGLWNKLSLGYSSDIEKKVKNKIEITFLTVGSLFIMGVYHLFLFFLRPKDKTPFFFGILSILLVFRTMAMEERIILDFLPFLPFLFVYRFEYIPAYLGLASFVLFVYYLFPKEFSKRFAYTILLVCLPATFLAFFFSPYVYASWTLRIIQLCMLTTILYTEAILVLAVRNKRMGALTFIIGTLIFFSAIASDILYSMGFIHTNHMASYGFLTFIFSQAIVLSMRFSNAFVTSEKLALELTDKSDSLLASNIELNSLKEGLENIVEERTKKLDEAYKKSYLEDKKIAELEAQIFTIQERENLFYDIHDHIKGDVTELGILIEQMKTYQIPIDILNQASSVLKRVFSSIKNRMLMLEDKQLLEADFINGLQMTLLRRYTAISRRFIFEISDSDSDIIKESSIAFRNLFFSVVKEISNNDMKYGFGDSQWKIYLTELKEIQLEMKSLSKYSSTLDAGMGHIGISQKVKLLSGTVKEEILDTVYTIQLSLPFRKEIF